MKRILIVIILSLVACTKAAEPDPQNGYPAIDLALPTLNSKAGNFASCDELVAWRNLKQQQYTYYTTWSGSPPPIYNVPNLSNSRAAASTTITQEDGIDEPDLLKADDTNIFVARSQSVEIISAASFQILQEITMSDLTNLRIFVNSGKLVILGQPLNTNVLYSSPADGLASPSPMYWPQPPQTFTVRIFAPSPGPAYSLESDQTFTGTYVGARLGNNTMTLVLHEDIPWGAPSLILNGQFHGLDCQSIQRPVFDDFSTELTSIHRLSLADDTTTSIAAMGRTDYMYMSKNYLYLVSMGLDWFNWDPRLQDQSTWQNLVLRKFTVDADTAAFQAAGLVNGTVISGWAFKESADQTVLYVATTSGYSGTNRLWALSTQDTNLNVAGFSTDFAVGEDIRSVHFAGSLAYIATYHESDPFYIFDLSDATHPALVSHIAMPGYSSFMQILPGGKLLGIGGITIDNAYVPNLQFSLLDISNPTQPQLLDQKIEGDNSSHAALTTDPHALFLDSDTGYAAIPAIFLAPVGDGTNAVAFSGATVLSFTDKITTVGGLSHSEWIPQACQDWLRTSGGWSTNPTTMDVSRVTKVKGMLISVSAFGVKASDPLLLTTKQQLQFSDENNECQRQITSSYGVSMGGSPIPD